MVHPAADSGRQTDLGNTNAKVSTSGSGLLPARDLLEQVAGAIEDYANALERRRRREGPASSVSEDVLERFRVSAAQLRRIAETRGSVSLAELLFEDFYGRKFDPATMVIVRDRPKHPSGDRTIKPGKTDIGLVPKLDFSEAQRSAKETRLRNYLQTWARSMMKAAPVRSWMDRVEKHLKELRQGGVEVSAEVESDLRAWIFEEAKARGLSEDVLRQWREWLRSPAERSNPADLTKEPSRTNPDDLKPNLIEGIGSGAAGIEIALNGKIYTRLGGESFYISTNQPSGTWKPPENTTALYIYKASNPKKMYRLDYHSLDGGQAVWHNNQVGVAGVKGLQVTNHSTTGATFTGRTLTLFHWGGRVMFFVSAASTAYDIYCAENKLRETIRQGGGWAGALAAGWAGAKIGGGIGAAAGSPAAGAGAAPGSVIGATAGGIVLGIGGWYGGSTISETIHDWVFTPLEKEEWQVVELPMRNGSPDEPATANGLTKE